MSDPIGTQGVSAPPDDLTTIYQGGENFLKRMKVLTAQRDAHEEAYAKLKLGTDAQAALTQANARMQEASALRDEAGALRDKAAKDGAAIVEKANWEAAQIKAAAFNEGKAETQRSGELRLEAENYAKKTKATADEVLKAAKATAAQATARLQDADAAAIKHRDAEGVANAANAQAQAMQELLAKKIAKVTEALREADAMT
jgi:hypothetical protein